MPGLKESFLTGTRQVGEKEFPMNIPDVPDNVVTLLTNAADAIDTANGSLNTSASNVNGVQNDTNKAVTNVTSTSQGLATDTLKDVWTNTQTDLGMASYILGLVTANTCMGGKPNPLRKAVEGGKSAIQDGLKAIERRNDFRRKATSQQLSFEETVEGIVQADSVGQQLSIFGLPFLLSLGPIGMALELLPWLGAGVEWMMVTIPGVNQTLLGLIIEWTLEIQNMEGELSNIAMALEVMLIAINNLNNNNFTAGRCATGFVPGTPPPTFPPNIFKMQGKGSGGTSDPYEDLANKYKNDPTLSNYTNIQIDDIVLEGEIQGLSPNQIEALLKSSFDGPSLIQLLKDGKINASNADDVISMLNSGVDPKMMNDWLTKGLVNSSNVGDVTSLCRDGVDPNTVNTWLTQGRKGIHQLAVTADNLATQGVSPAAIKSLFSQNINFDNVSASIQTLRARGVPVSDINNRILNSTDVGNWQNKLSSYGYSQDQVATCLQRWRNHTALGGVGSNDGGVYGNSNNAFPPPIDPPLQEYYVPNQSSSGRILIDNSGKAFFYPDHYNPRTRIPIPFDVLLSLLG
jgi:hypothetical protein